MRNQFAHMHFRRRLEGKKKPWRRSKTLARDRRSWPYRYCRCIDCNRSTQGTSMVYQDMAMQLKCIMRAMHFQTERHHPSPATNRTKCLQMHTALPPTKKVRAHLSPIVLQKSSLPSHHKEKNQPPFSPEPNGNNRVWPPQVSASLNSAQNVSRSLTQRSTEAQSSHQILRFDELRPLAMARPVAEATKYVRDLRIRKAVQIQPVGVS